MTVMSQGSSGDGIWQTTPLIETRISELYDRLALHVKDWSGGIVAIFLDFDRFHIINSTEGRHAGDKLLADFWGLLADALRGVGYGVRFGGDKFLCIVSGDRDKALALVDSLRAEIQDLPANRDCRLTLRVGLCDVPKSGTPSAIRDAIALLAYAVQEPLRRQGPDSVAWISGTWEAPEIDRCR